MSARRKSEPWEQEVEWARTICAAFNCAVERSPHQFEIATVKGDGVSLLIYPHKTSANNYHVRVRNNGSKDMAKAAHVMKAMFRGEGLPEKESERVRFSCTFSVKNAVLS